MNQISVSRMNLNHPKPGFAGPTCSLPESRDDRANFFLGCGHGNGVMIGKSDGARSNDFVPSTLGFGNLALALPWPVGTCFASSMRQLHACNAPLLMNETHDPGQRFDVIVSPDPKVLRTDTAFGEHSRRLGKHKSSAA